MTSDKPTLPLSDLADGSNIADHEPIKFEYKHLLSYLQNLDKLIGKETTIGEYIQIGLLFKILSSLEEIRGANKK